MGFFKEFKDDFSEAVDEIISSDEGEVTSEDDIINTLADNIDVDQEMTKLDGLLEKANESVMGEPKEDTMVSDVALENNISRGLKEMDNNIYSNTPVATPASDENAIITTGMTITGDIDTSGSIEIQGRVNGNLRCSGKLTVTGMINGNSAASEVFADAARIDGEITASGTIKVGAGSVVVGNITATSAVIAGAVKGDIDVNGPVVIDTSAIVMGNVKSASVQIHNGAIIEGFCSQAYSEVDVNKVFA